MNCWKQYLLISCGLLFCAQKSVASFQCWNACDSPAGHLSMDCSRPNRKRICSLPSLSRQKHMFHFRNLWTYIHRWLFRCRFMRPCVHGPTYIPKFLTFYFVRQRDSHVWVPHCPKCFERIAVAVFVAKFVSWRQHNFQLVSPFLWRGSKQSPFFPWTNLKNGKAPGKNSSYWRK